LSQIPLEQGASGLPHVYVLAPRSVGPILARHSHGLAVDAAEQAREALNVGEWVEPAWSRVPYDDHHWVRSLSGGEVFEILRIDVGDEWVARLRAVPATDADRRNAMMRECWASAWHEYRRTNPGAATWLPPPDHPAETTTADAPRHAPAFEAAAQDLAVYVVAPRPTGPFDFRYSREAAMELAEGWRRQSVGEPWRESQWSAIPGVDGRYVRTAGQDRIPCDIYIAHMPAGVAEMLDNEHALGDEIEHEFIDSQRLGWDHFRRALPQVANWLPLLEDSPQPRRGPWWRRGRGQADLHV